MVHLNEIFNERDKRDKQETKKNVWVVLNLYLNIYYYYFKNKDNF